MKVSFLIPVVSEVQSLKETIRLIDETCQGYIHEILLLMHQRAAPACRRLCQELSKSRNDVILHEQKRYPGQGYAFREGLEIASGSHILMMNADLETEPRDAIRLVQTMEKKSADLVVASRWGKGAAFDRKGYGSFKILLNWLFQRFFGMLFSTPISDLTFGYKIARSDLFRSIRWEGTGHEFSMETTVKPIVMKCQVEQIPTSWVARSEGVSSQKYFRNLRHVMLAFKIFFRSIFQEKTQYEKVQFP